MTSHAAGVRRENSPQPVARIEPLNRNDDCDSVSLSSPKGGLESLGKQRKESAESGGPLRAERAGASESLGRGEEAFRVPGKFIECWMLDVRCSMFPGSSWGGAPNCSRGAALPNIRLHRDGKVADSGTVRPLEIRHLGSYG